MKKLSLEQVLAHPIAQSLDPRTNDFITMRWLSQSLNPHRNKDNIEIGAAIAFQNLPHIKTVAAFGMMMEDFEHGRYDGITRLVVPSSGNTAHGCAVLAKVFGIPSVTVVMASDTPEAKKSVITMIPWARLVCPPGTQSVEDAAEEEASRPESYLLDQYKHPGNARIHRECTGPQLFRAAGNNLGLVAIAMGSGGTATGVAQYLKSINPDIIVIGVRPKRGERIPGTRDADQMDAVVTIPYKEIVDEIVESTRETSFVKARELMSEVQPQVGPSSGLAYAGLLQYLANSADSRDLLRGKRAAFICPDDGRFYPGPTLATLDPNQGM